jgi:CheB methylesterase
VDDLIQEFLVESKVIVQDQASSVVWGMPGSVVSAALADSVYSLSTMAGEIVRRVNTRRPGSMHLANNRSNSQSRTEHQEIRPAR